MLWGNFSDVENFFCFDLIQRVPLLQIPKYSSYQEFLFVTISNLRKKDEAFSKIAVWLNENGYSTVRGKTFRSAHVYSIIKKKRDKDDKLSKRYEPKLSNFGIRFIDRTLNNSK